MKLKSIIDNKFKLSNNPDDAYFDPEKANVKEEKNENKEDKKEQLEEKKDLKYNAYVFVYDVNNRASYDDIKSVIELILAVEANEKRGKEIDEKEFPVKFILGNKKDLFSKQHLAKEELEFLEDQKI